jgi:phenylalanyl-tRNA synthetase alpha chain
VYRRDEIDRSHYPVFHQMEGVRLFTIPEVNNLTKSTVFASHDRTETAQELHTEETAAFLAADLKATLTGLVVEIFGDVECRWVDCYFPFTHPSYELEIFFNGEWLEVLGCGVMEQQVLLHPPTPTLTTISPTCLARP